MNIFLIGYMGSGKTTLGKKLARELGYDFVDMDAFIEQEKGKTIAQIFSEEGEAAFRELEGETLRILGKNNNQVIATGGGVPCFHDHLSEMQSMGITVYLEMSPEALVHRLMEATQERPLVKGKSREELLGYIRQHLREREVFYKKAQLIFPGMDPDVKALADAVKRVVGS